MSLPRPTACPAYRERLVAVAGGEARDRDLDAHVSTCTGCNAYLARAARHVRAFASLARRAAPRDLDGRVVAATQAGFRQDRAVRALGLLAPAPMPAEGERALWSGADNLHAGLTAPSELDGRVEAELRAQGGDPGARMMRHLVRRPAPSVLDGRVNQVYEVSRRRRARAERRLLVTGAAVLLMALTAAVTLFLARPRDVSAGDVARGQIESSRGQVERTRSREVLIQRVSSLSEFDPVLSSVFSGLTAGASDAVTVKGGKL